MVGVQQSWSVTASSNGSADSNINYAEGQTPASLNDAARAGMAAVKGLANQLLGAKTSGGSSNGYTFTSDAVAAVTAYAAGMGFVFKANHTNTGASTLNVDGVGATAIRKGGAETALASGDIVEDGMYFVVYNGTYWILLNPETGQAASGFQPLDATLTALAALSWSSGNEYIAMTAADTFALSASPQIDAIELGHASDTTVTRSAAGMMAVEGTDVVLCAGAQSIAGEKSFTDDLILASTTPVLHIRDTDATTNVKRWGIENSGGQLQFILYDDSGTPAANAFYLTRSGFTPVEAVFAGGLQARVANSSETSGSLTSASRNRRVALSGGATLPSTGMTAGDFILLDPGGTARTITRPGSHTMYVRDSDVATDDTYAHNVALAIYHGSSKWTLHGMP